MNLFFSLDGFVSRLDDYAAAGNVDALVLVNTLINEMEPCFHGHPRTADLLYHMAYTAECRARACKLRLQGNIRRAIAFEGFADARVDYCRRVISLA